MNLLDNYLSSRKLEEENQGIETYGNVLLGLSDAQDIDKEDKEEIKGRGRKGKRWTKRRW